MAARSVQTGLGPAVAHVVLVKLALGASSVLLTVKIFAAP
jgi:hypothetical protein